MAFQDAAQQVQLAVNIVAGHLVRRVHQQQLPFAALQLLRDLIRQELLRHPGARHGLHAQHIPHAVYLLHLPDHGPHLPVGKAGVHQQHVGRGHTEVLAELFVGRHIGHILRQALPHVVVHLAVGPLIPIQGGRNDHQEHCEKDGENFDHTR